MARDEPACETRLGRIKAIIWGNEVESGSPSEQWKAAVGLAFFNEKSALPSIIEGLESPDNWVRWEAVRSLAKVHDEMTVPTLVPRLKDPDEKIRRETVMTLGHIANEAAVAELIDLLDHHDPQIRWRAAMGLGRSSRPSSLEPLKKRLTVERDDQVRSSIERALQSIERKKEGSGR